MKGHVIILLLLLSALAFSQEKDKALPAGNKKFINKEYREAEADYRVSASRTGSATSSYNLGNAIYRQKQAGEAAFAYGRAIEMAKTKQQKHMAYHNLGNSLMKEKNYQGAVEAYKNALRNNPGDEQTRYNFALAKKFLKDNPPPPPEKQPKDKDKKDNKSQDPKDKNEGSGGNDQKDKSGGEGDKKDKGDDGKDQKDKSGGNDQQKDKGGQDNKGKDNPAGASPSKQRMENLLDAMNNEERKIQDKVNAQKAKGQPKRQEKDW